MAAKTSNAAAPVPPIAVTSLGRVSWVLFEWGRNPYVLVITIYVYATYFTRDIVGDPVRGQALWAAFQGYAGLAVALLAPFLGAIADAGGRRKPWLVFFGAVLAVSTACLWFGRPGGAGIGVFGVGMLVAIGSLGYDGSLVFHGAMLPSLMPKDRIGRWSGLGYALGNLAGILLLVFILLFIYLPERPLFGLDRVSHEHERISGPLEALWFIVFSLPFFLFTPDRPPTGLSARDAVRKGLSSVVRTAKSLPHYRNVATYLAARMIYNDGLNAMLVFGGIYAAGVFHWGEVESALYGIVLSVFAALGGFLGGRLADRIGTKRALLVSVGGTTLTALLLLGFAPDRLFFVFPYQPGTPVAALPVFRTAPELFYIASAMLVAVCLVASYANSRAMLARIAPEAKMTEFFGLYALSGEATAFAAPIFVARATSLSGSQQWGLGAIIVFLSVGFVVLTFVREERAETA
ncbi:MAG TPA: MFS transporter [Micropepsaceae bacterium]|nr:MFS transporter [Micropepsaceae bacterium]